jgi:D-beta-D-heptose 7-phosphate kinase/D-beta-D-heptose 1-phosphate adenosyltransferase
MIHAAAELSLHLSQFKGRRVLVVGDIMVDRFIYGDVKRISPEAPVPVVRITREFSQLGGAGNVARNAASLGASVGFFSVIGDDRAGQEVTELMSGLDGIEPFLRINRQRETTIKNRFFSADGHHLLRADRETVAPVAPEDEGDLIQAFRREVEKADAVVVSDYGKGVMSPALCRAVVEAARAAGVPVVVDPKGEDYAIYHGATVVTPNRAELALASGQAITNDEDISAAAQALMVATNLHAVLVTRSAEGMTLFQSGQPPLHFEAESQEVADVTGAGDTVAAVLGLALAAGASLDHGARLANAAAGLVVRRRGTAVVTTRELAAALLRRDLSAAESKVVDLPAAAAKAAMWRKDGRTVGFTNGCFDLLHPGHVSLLTEAKSHCDRLIVGLNSDASVGRLKGPGRPVQPEAARAAVMASMQMVDLVVVFNEDTPLDLIKALQPGVLVKGADYTKNEVVGGDIVEASGGRIVLADLVDSYSTTATIAALKEGVR